MAARVGARCRRLEEPLAGPQEVLAAVMGPRVCSRESPAGFRGRLGVGMHLLEGLRNHLTAVPEPPVRSHE